MSPSNSLTREPYRTSGEAMLPESHRRKKRKVVDSAPGDDNKFEDSALLNTLFTCSQCCPCGGSMGCSWISMQPSIGCGRVVPRL